MIKTCPGAGPELFLSSAWKTSWKSTTRYYVHPRPGPVEIEFQILSGILLFYRRIPKFNVSWWCSEVWWWFDWWFNAHLTVGRISVDPLCTAGAFGNYFYSKIKSNVSKAQVNVGGVYNGKCKIIVQNRNFMTENDVKLCLSELKNKKCEGFDRIPLCMLLDARVALLPPMAVLFNEIYLTC